MTKNSSLIYTEFSSKNTDFQSAITRDPPMASQDMSVMQAIAVMQNEGYVLVADDPSQQNRENTLLGIFTERDLVRISLQRLNLDTLTLQNVMSPVETIQESELSDFNNNIQSLLATYQKQVRYLPVLNGDRLIGVLDKEKFAEILAGIVASLGNHQANEETLKVNEQFLRSIYEGVDQSIFLEQQTQALEQLNQELDLRVEERTVELDLMESKIRYASLAAAAPIAIFRFDSLGKCTYVNERWSEMTGYPAESALGEGWINTLHPEDREVLVNQWTQSYTQANSVKQIINYAEGRHLRPDGSINWFYVQVAQEFDAEHNNVIGYIGTLTDITDRKRLEQEQKDYEKLLEHSNAELIRATRLKDEFLANMSHELRTPLNAILGMSESLLDKILGNLNERQSSAIATIESSGQHLLALINEILELSKIEAGKLDLEISKVDIAELCQSSLNFVKQQAFKKQIRLTARLPKDLGVMDLDERRIRQVLINLLTNAVKFTPIAGQVTLEVNYEPIEINLSEPIPLFRIRKPINLDDQGCHIDFQKYLCISVIDTGIGISEADQEKLFKPFVQIDSSLNRQYEGTGLGLALVKQIVELHGGNVTLHSQRGSGSNFTVRLPYVCKLEKLPAIDSQLNSSTLVSSHADDNKSIKEICFSETNIDNNPLILIAEDNEANLVTFSSYLEAKNYRTVIAKNGVEAIALTKSHHPNLILIDIQMPVMDGLEAIRQIRIDDDSKDIPIIALTALTMDGDREKCLETGATDYLSKPVKLKQLTNLIQQYL